MTNKFLRRAITAIGLGSSALCVVVMPVPRVDVQAADKPVAQSEAWSPKAAAHYLDSRETWWQGWGRAQKDHGTLCVSCHTQASYALARPMLRSQDGEHAPSAQEQVMLASVEKRVRAWKDMEPFY